MSLPPSIRKNVTTDVHGYTPIKADQLRRTPGAQIAQRHPRKCLTKAMPIANVFLNDFFFSYIFIRVNPRPSVVSRPRCYSKQAMLLAGRFEAEVFVGERGGDAAALGAVEEAELH